MRAISFATINFDGSGNNVPVSITTHFVTGSGNISSVTSVFEDGSALVTDPDGGVQVSPLINVSVADATGQLGV